MTREPLPDGADLIAHLRREGTDDLIIELGRSLFNPVNFYKLLKPGATARSKPVDILGRAIVGDKGESHAELLHRLADVIERVNTPP